MFHGRFLIPAFGVWMAATAGASIRGSHDDFATVTTGHAQQQRSLATSFVDFSPFSPGDIITTVASGVNVSALMRLTNGSLAPGDAMVFDSSSPTGGDYDLGTPHYVFGGPGYGGGGNNKSLFPNSLPQGNVLIISSDGNSADPNDYRHGGFLTFTFDPPLNISTIGLLDNDEGAHFEIVSKDGGHTVIINENGGNNSFESVAIGKPQVVKLVVNFIGSGAITFITTGVEPCVANPVFDLEMFSAGDWVSSLPNGITVVVNKTGELATEPAMIFNSSNPTGGDLDLGTPHKTFGGPGRGKAGKKGQLYENSESLGNVLIISADGNTTAPNDAAVGGDIVITFPTPTYVDSLGVLDNESGFVIEVFTDDGDSSVYANMMGGNNSFERMMIMKPNVVKVVAHLLGSGAITTLNGECV